MIVNLIKLLPKLDVRLGRVVYGNLTSFSYNFAGRKNLRALRSKHIPIDNQDKSFLWSMKVNGYYQAPFCLPSEVMTAVVDEYHSALDNPNRSQDIMSTKAKEAGLPVYCRSVDYEHLELLHLLLTDEINQLISYYFGGKPHVILGCARRNQHIPPEIAKTYDIYSNSWHCDNEPSDRIKMFVALSNINENCGPLHMLPRPRTRSILKQGFKHRDDYGIPLEIIEDPKHLIKFTGKVGSVFFVNVTQCLHRAGIPQPGYYRDIVEFQFRGS